MDTRRSSTWINISALASLAALVALAEGCGGDSERDGADAPPIDVAARGLVSTVDGVFFCPPLGGGGASGPFDGTLLARVAVRLESTGSDGVTRLDATFDNRTTPQVIILPDREVYFVDVRAATYFTDASRAYRFRVVLGTYDLGWADVPGQIFGAIATNPGLMFGVKVRIESRPAPAVAALTPSALPAGSGGFVLTVDGAGFVRDSAVQLSGTPLPTTRVSSARLTAVVPSTVVAAPGAAEVVVVTPAPGGGVSAPAPFVVRRSCGDGFCSPGELQATCSVDCTTPPPAAPTGTCGNGVCEPYSESPVTCASDCPARATTQTCARNYKVQDGNCQPELNEGSDTCPEDCVSVLSNGVPTLSLPDLGASTYKGFVGGLYPDGQNTMPPDHLAAGRAKAAELVPLDTQGAYDPQNGKIVMISIGMSNTTQEFCHFDGYTNTIAPQCQPWTFMGRARDDAAVNHSTLALVNGARGGMSIENWVTPQAPHVIPTCAPYSNASAYPASSLALGTNHLFDDEWDRVNACSLAAHGYDYRQVQVAWVKLARQGTTFGALPYANAEAYALKRDLGNVLRTMKGRYPNLKLVFLSSRVYGGFTGRNQAEPFAFEQGFGVKWLIEAQINQRRNGGRVVEDPASPSYAGDLDDATGVVPWIGWGPYLWANGANATSTGTQWLRGDFFPAYESDYNQADGTHPNRDGEGKIGALLLDFFETSPLTACWFLAGRSCAL